MKYEIKEIPIIDENNRSDYSVYNLYMNGEYIYEGNSLEDCLEGILNRENIDYKIIKD